MQLLTVVLDVLEVFVVSVVQDVLVVEGLLLVLEVVHEVELELELDEEELEDDVEVVLDVELELVDDDVVLGQTGEIGIDEELLVEVLDELVVEETTGQPSLGDVSLVYV